MPTMDYINHTPNIQRREIAVFGTKPE